MVGHREHGEEEYERDEREGESVVVTRVASGQMTRHTTLVGERKEHGLQMGLLEGVGDGECR